LRVDPTNLLLTVGPFQADIDAVGTDLSCPIQRSDPVCVIFASNKALRLLQKRGFVAVCPCCYMSK
jgi:hypothetical protein